MAVDRRQLRQWLTDNSQPAYRAEQVLQWVYSHRVSSFDEMSNLPKDLREVLARCWHLRQSSLQSTVNCDDGTVKLLLQWPDQALTETVLISSSRRQTVCISSQVGCPVGCDFCASGKGGLQRSLDAGEMTEQVMRAQELLPADQRISNVVVMGMGEPLANYDSTLKAVKTINASWSLNIGARHITVSTIGIPEGIRKLAREPIQLTLAVSLHAGDDWLRAQLVPWAEKYSLADIFDAIDYYYQQTHREVTLEYTLLAGCNCSPADADKLTRWARRSRCNVNLIKYNPIENSDYQPPSDQAVNVFMRRLQDNGVNVHLRRSRGRNIDAACGQLRLKKM